MFTVRIGYRQQYEFPIADEVHDDVEISFNTPGLLEIVSTHESNKRTIAIPWDRIAYVIVDEEVQNI